MSELVAIVPSRGRPHAVAEMAEAFRETCTSSIRLVFAIDEDDPARDSYLHAVMDATYGRRPIGVNRGVWAGYCVVDAPSNMVNTLNRAAMIVSTWENADAIAFLGDDHRPRTKGWDQAYLDAMREMGTGIVYGNDLFQGERIPTQVAMTSDIIRTLGYMAPPDLKHLYVDDAWLQLGRAIGKIRYLPDVVVEHLHPVANKAEWDEGYARVNSRDMYTRDHAAYSRWLAESLPAEAARLKQMMSR